MAFINYDGKYYALSKDVRVFPCAYRGYYGTNGTNAKVFDPEARATTEANFADTFSKLSLKKPSYVVEWAGGTLKCVIDGYYFEIENCTLNDFYTVDQNKAVLPNALCIKPKEITLSSSAEDGDRPTQILSAITGDSEYLDSQVGTNYIFTGLCLVPHSHSTVTTAGIKSLVPFKATSTGENDDQGNPIYIKELDPAKLAITELLDAGTGKYSIRMLSDTDGGTSNDTQANGDYAVSFGKRAKAGKFSGTFGNLTEATGEAAFAFGDTAKAQAKGTLAGGDHATAANPGSVALGTYVTTNADNQVVLGKHNQTDSSKALILANGTAAAKYNILTVSYEGDVAAKGDLDIDGKADIGGALTVDGALTLNSTLTTKGNITANGTGGNDLVLGSSTSGSYGSISVYGEGTTKVFDVTKDGNLEIAGKAKSSATVDSDNETTLTTKGYMESYVAGAITARIAGKADSTTVATNLTNAINEAKEELIESNNIAIATAVATAKAELLASVSADFAARDTSSSTPVSGNGTGKYVLSVSQTNGQIATTEGSFVTSIASDNQSDAPTAAAVHSHVSTAVSNIWTSDVVKETSTATSKKSLQSIILDAAYPVGSIFTYYSESNVDTCPIATSLGGTWKKIKAGTFLCAAESDSSSLYNRDKTGGFEETQLKAHDHSLVRVSTYDTNKNSTTVVSESNGSHTHKLKILARAHDASTDNGLRSGKTEDGGCHQWTFTYTTESAGSHTHDINLDKIKTSSAGTDISTTKGTNLPPYLAVYMWKRTA